MIRRIIQINQELCNGCGICVDACHENAIEIINNKATLLRDDYCDGLGNCLPVCPTNAITFIERDALPYNDEEVQRNIANKSKLDTPIISSFSGCPGSQSKTLIHNNSSTEDNRNCMESIPSQLNQWPVQIQLVSPNAPFLSNCDLLIAADCTAFAYGNFHNDFLKGRIALIGCPKLDTVDYSEKLTDVITRNQINSITVVRMSVPCCGGIVYATQKAIENSKKQIPLHTVILSIDGTIQNETKSS